MSAREFDSIAAPLLVELALSLTLVLSLIIVWESINVLVFGSKAPDASRPILNTVSLASS